LELRKRARQIPEHSLRLYNGWTKTSKMPEVYTHELGDEISNQILELEGYSTKSKEQKNILKPKVCTNCNKSNKINSKFWAKCKFVPSYDAYNEVIENTERQSQSKIETRENRVEEVTTALQKFTELIALQFGWESRHGKDKNETERMKRQLYQDLCKEGVRSAHWFID
jgi:hypothetical protein